MPFKEYADELQRNLKSGQATEPSYYPALKSLLEAFDPKLSVLQNPKKTEHGSPDFRLTRKRTIEFPVGWIEAKIPGEDLNKIERSDQLKRYYHLPNLILTDFLDFRWYTDGKLRLKASLGVLADGKCKLDAEGRASVEELLHGFLAHRTPPAKDSRELARRMAQLAHFIREAILVAHEREPQTGILHQQMDAFREALIPDLDDEQFADMYAQTIAYGLFAARCQPAASTGFTRDNAARLIPKTNPFLQKMFYVIAGPDLPDSILPYVDDLVSLLRDTDIGAIMADFGKRTAKEDPVVHFYEDFLQAYDPKLRELRGVYYTPEPVVSYIVRSIDYILKNQFSKPMGLADKDVLILDPACGTGTFLYFVIRHIHDTLCQHGQKGQWNSYVSEHLLKRIFGFELLMAPYAVAHLKLGLLLQELGYKFESDERLGVYLTNTLEEAAKKAQHLFAFADAIAEEARLAGDVKLNKKVMVVLGNPPYSGHSANRSWEIRNGKRVPTFIGDLLQDYYKVDGQPLGEKNPKWLQDDYVKFIRFAQWRIDRTGYGILGFITNHGYLDNPTFRGMRQQLMRDFSEIHILDLHGNSKKKERAPDGSPDENVFDIQQGVAVGIFTRPMASRPSRVLHHADLWGERQAKYKSLPETDISKTEWQELRASPPAYLFVPRESALVDEYERGWKLPDIFPTNSVGIVTARDDLTIAFTREELWKRIQDFVGLSAEEARQKYDLGKDAQDWKVGWAQRDLKESGPKQQNILPILYRPFDFRHTYYTGHSMGFMVRPRPEVMRRMILRRNIGMLWTRPMSPNYEFSVLVSDCIVDQCAVGNKSAGAGISYLAPLLSYASDDEILQLHESSPDANINFNPDFLRHIQNIVRFDLLTDFAIRFADPEGPRCVVNYIYATLHSPTFRKRYSSFLKVDFPRVPLISDKKLFAALAEKGAELVSLHLMQSPALAKFITKYEQPGDHEVKKVSYVEPNPKAGIKSGRVYINDAQFFDGVPREVWEFHIGGYHVCAKWLKDRKGRKLSSDDIDHYQKIVVALAETIRLMREIDEIIPGWPLSF
jgi:predicted helicase